MSNYLIRVVIVDDHQMVRETWRMILEKDERIDIIGECSSGEEAIEAAQNLIPDVMLLDVNMSPLNGFETTKLIRKLHPHIKVIGISVQNQPSYARHMIRLGARGYVTKNCDSTEMAEAIVQVHKGHLFICKEMRESLLEK